MFHDLCCWPSCAAVTLLAVILNPGGLVLGLGRPVLVAVRSRFLSPLLVALPSHRL